MARIELAAKVLDLPSDGEAGLKPIRRSTAHLVRQRLEAKEKPLDQLEVFLGDRVFDAVSELYAPFSPSYLKDPSISPEYGGAFNLR